MGPRQTDTGPAAQRRKILNLAIKSSSTDRPAAVTDMFQLPAGDYFVDLSRMLPPFRHISADFFSKSSKGDIIKTRMRPLAVIEVKFRLFSHQRLDLSAFNHHRLLNVR